MGETKQRPPHMPASTPDYMAQAWVDCLRWAASSPEVLRDFEAATGVRARPVRTPLDAMIENATGYNRDCFEKFVAWFNENVWGDVDGSEDASPARAGRSTGNGNA